MKIDFDIDDFKDILFAPTERDMYKERIDETLKFISEEYKNIDTYDRWILDRIRYILKGSDKE